MAYKPKYSTDPVLEALGLLKDATRHLESAISYAKYHPEIYIPYDWVEEAEKLVKQIADSKLINLNRKD
jgi:hypothetical protein